MWLAEERCTLRSNEKTKAKGPKNFKNYTTSKGARMLLFEI